MNLKIFLEWLERVLPGLLAAFGVGYKLGKSGKEDVEADLNTAKLELKLKENHEKVDRDNAGVTPVDGVNKIAGPKEE